DAVRLDRLEEVVRPVACAIVVRAVRPAPVEDEGDEGDCEHRRGERQRAWPGDAFRESLPERGEPDPCPDPPEAEADDEEVVPFADLAPLHRYRPAPLPGVAVLE